MSQEIFFTVSDGTPLKELYDRLSFGVDVIEKHIDLAHPRARPTVEQGIRALRRFIAGELGTDEGAKKWFKAFTKLAEEVGDMNPSQSAYLLACAEVAHGASHMGHVNMALSRGGRTAIDREYVKLQTAYVNFGLKGVDEFLKLADPSLKPYFTFDQEAVA